MTTVLHNIERAYKIYDFYVSQPEYYREPKMESQLRKNCEIASKFAINFLYPTSS